MEKNEGILLYSFFSGKKNELLNVTEIIMSFQKLKYYKKLLSLDLIE